MALIIGGALLGPRIARADAVIKTYTFPSPLLGYTSATGASFNQFDPALGVLLSVTLHATATATWSGGFDTDFNDAEYVIFLSGSAFTMGAATVGNGSAPASANFTDITPTVLSALTGSGLVDTSVSVLNQGGTPASISSTFGTESVTYNYAPSMPGIPPIGSAVPVPEPSSLAILAVGLLGLGWISRRAPRPLEWITSDWCPPVLSLPSGHLMKALHIAQASAVADRQPQDHSSSPSPSCSVPPMSPSPEFFNGIQIFGTTQGID